MLNRIAALAYFVLFITGCQQSGGDLTAQDVLHSCQQALDNKDSKTANKDCPFAEQWLTRTQPDSLLHAQALEKSADALSAFNQELAATYYQQALDTREKLADKNDNLQPLQIKLANALNSIGKWSAAEIAYKQLLRLLEANKAADSVEAGDILNQLGIAQFQQKLYIEAEQSLTKAASIRATKLDSKNSALGDTYNNLGVLYQNTGRLQEAENFYRKAINIQEGATPTPYPQLFDSFNNIATLLQNSGKTSESEPYWKKLLVVAEKAYGKDSLQYAQVLDGLGIQALNARQYALAEANLGACIQIREKILGTGHLLTGDTAYNLAIALANQGKSAQALGLMRHAFAVAQVGLGINSPVTAQRLEKLKNLEKGTLTEQIQPAQQVPQAAPQTTKTTKSKKKSRH